MPQKVKKGSRRRKLGLDQLPSWLFGEWGTQAQVLVAGAQAKDGQTAESFDDMLADFRTQDLITSTILDHDSLYHAFRHH